MLKRTTLLFLAALTTGAFAFPTLEFTGVQKGLNAKITYNNGSSYEDVFAGELGMKLRTVTDTSLFAGYCTSVNVWLKTSGQWGVSILDTSSLSPNGLRTGYLVNKYEPTIKLSGNNDEARAMQLVIWELTAETSGTFDLAHGSFRASEMNGSALSANTMSYANAYLADLGVGLAKYYRAEINHDGVKVSQDIVAPNPGQPVPEPASICMLALGLGGVLRKKIRR